MKVTDPYSHGEVRHAFGATLRSVRKERNISQDKLADLCDFDRTYPSLLERGLRHPTLSMLLRLADALDVDATRLVAATVARLRGELPVCIDPDQRLYRFAWLADGILLPVGRAYWETELDEIKWIAESKGKLQNGETKPFACTHIVIYDAVRAVEVLKPASPESEGMS